MKIIQAYQTEDGRIFDSAEEAEKHEDAEAYQLRKQLQLFVSHTHPDGRLQFSVGHPVIDGSCFKVCLIRDAIAKHKNTLQIINHAAQAENVLRNGTFSRETELVTYLAHRPAFAKVLEIIEAEN